MRIFRCLIVDDEELILDRLEQLFGEYSDRFRLIGRALSGEEALEIIRARSPDIVLTDIVMPGMDGLALIEQIKRQAPHTPCIILSAYSNFEYAKQAMKVGVDEYLIKVPLSSEELRLALHKTADEVEAREAKLSEWTQYTQSRLENRYRLRKQLFQEVLGGEAGTGQLGKLREELGLELHNERYSCIVAAISDMAGFKESFREPDQALLRFAFINIMEETLKSYGNGFALELGDGRFMGIVSGSESSSFSAQLFRSTEMGQAVIRGARTYLKLDVDAAFSCVYHAWSEIREAYHEAADRLELAYYSRPGQYIPLSEEIRSLPGGEEAAQTWYETVVDGLRSSPLDQSIRLLDDGYRLARHYRLRPRLVTDRLGKLLIEAQALLKDRVDVPVQLPRLESLKLKAQLDMVKACLRELHEQMHRSRRPEIRKAKQYIEAHIVEKLTLERIAEHVNLTSNYFSAVFKKEEGQNLTDYINRKKVDKAVELLRQEDYDNFELSEMVGISNEKYFCTLFKKWYGLPPQKYRKHLL